MRAHVAAVAATIGAWWAPAVPPLLVIALVALALWRRGPVAIGLAVLAATALLGARAQAGLDPPAPGPVSGWVTLVDDPRPSGAGVRARVRSHGRLLDATAYGSVAGRLDDHLAGERLLVEGRVRPSRSDYDRWRHVVGRLTIVAVIDDAPASPLLSFTNRIRRLLATGASSLSDDRRAVFTGMVVGDDRDQAPVVADDFRAAGLGHLLVVSGQNVAFVLAVTAPLTSRFRPAGRLLAIVAVLAAFATLTRFEPSVMRAVAMAGLAVGAAALGRPTDGRRILSVAAVAVILVDPFVVRLLAFQLSVAATAGIVWLGPRIQQWVPGPEPLAVAVATTAGAQVAVAPLLVTAFESVPLASLPANLLAGPVSGPVMMWGATAGLLAGLVGGAAAALIHLPTTAMIWWIQSVAAVAAAAPPATLGRFGALTLFATAVVAAAARSRRARAAALVSASAVIVMALTSIPAPRQGWQHLDGFDLWHGAGVDIVVLDQPRSPTDLLGELRRSGVGRPDLVVAARGSVSDAHAVVALTDRFGRLAIVAPPRHRVPHGRSVEPGSRLAVGAAVVTVASVEPCVEIAVTPVAVAR